MKQVIGVGLRVLLAVFLAALAWVVPDVGGLNAQAERTTRLAKDRIEELATRMEQPPGRQRQAILLDLAARNERLASALAEVDHDPRSTQQLRDALAGIAEGLTAMARLFDEAPARQLGHGLGEAADYLDRQVAAAEKAAQRLDEAGDVLQSDALLLAELFRGAPLDLEGLQQVHDGLGKFVEGAEALCRVLEMPNLPGIRTGLQGLEMSMSAGARQVDLLAGYSYPVVYWEGWRPRTSQQPFWPVGTRLATGLTDAAKGIQAADKELAALSTELPKLRVGVAGCRDVVNVAKESLANVLSQRDVIESLARSLPETASQLAEDLPKLSKELAATLRETKRLREVATGLRATQERIDQAVATWPSARKSLVHAAAGLQAHGEELDRWLQARACGQDGNGAVGRSVKELREVLPGWSQDVDKLLEAEKADLTNLATGLEELAVVQSQQTGVLEAVGSLLRWGLLASSLVVCVQAVSTARKLATPPA